MAKMSWQYIAGFFDGEGSIGLYRDHHSGKATMRASIPQSEKNDGLVVLTVIREFLEANGVTIKSISKNNSPVRKGGVPIYCLAVGRLESLKLFLVGIRPYVIVKKIAVEDHLRYLQIFPDLTPYRYEVRNMMECGTRLTETDVMQIKILRALKRKSQPQLSKQFKIARTTVSAIENNRNWKRLLPFIGDNSAYQQYYPSRQLTL